ncbi:hypothetical protein ACFCYM_11725 [Streptomyces sp. NPDC056254]|uniref:hypothetical protein n=1 Tax=Streptomyces sp. NPDC056254 TaxID=3345763 RepID=UPI0035E049B8
MLGAGRYDAIVYGEVNEHEVALPEGALARTLIPKEPFAIRLSTRHPLAGRDRINLADLAGESWMTPVEDDAEGPRRSSRPARRPGSARHCATGSPTARCTTTWSRPAARSRCASRRPRRPRAR